MFKIEYSSCDTTNFAISLCFKGYDREVIYHVHIRNPTLVIGKDSVLSNGTLMSKQVLLSVLRTRCSMWICTTFKLRLLTFLLQAVEFSATNAVEN